MTITTTTNITITTILIIVAIIITIMLPLLINIIITMMMSKFRPNWGRVAESRGGAKPTAKRELPPSCIINITIIILCIGYINIGLARFEPLWGYEKWHIRCKLVYL